MGRHKGKNNGKYRKASYGGRPSLAIIYKGYNQTRLAKFCGMNVAHVGKILKGERTPRLEKAVLMARYLGVTIQEFLDKLEWARKRAQQ